MWLENLNFYLFLQENGLGDQERKRKATAKSCHSMDTFVTNTDSVVGEVSHLKNLTRKIETLHFKTLGLKMSNKKNHFKAFLCPLFLLHGAALTISQQASKMHQPFPCFSNRTNQKCPTSEATVLNLSLLISNHISALLYAVHFLFWEDEPHYKHNAIIQPLR